MIEATVIAARCQRSGDCFGLRVERSDNSTETWTGTWAFSLSGTRARREGYDNAIVSGHIYLSGEYPGCPRCGSEGIGQCPDCNKISCFEGSESSVTCPHCGRTSKVGGPRPFDQIQGSSF